MEVMVQVKTTELSVRIWQDWSGSVDIDPVLDIGAYREGSGCRRVFERLCCPVEEGWLAHLIFGWTALDAVCRVYKALKQTDLVNHDYDGTINEVMEALRKMLGIKVTELNEKLNLVDEEMKRGGTIYG